MVVSTVLLRSHLSHRFNPQHTTPIYNTLLQLICNLCNEGLHVWCIVLALQVEAIKPVGLMIIVCHLAMAVSTALLRSHLSHRFNPQHTHMESYGIQ